MTPAQHQNSTLGPAIWTMLQNDPQPAFRLNGGMRTTQDIDEERINELLTAIQNAHRLLDQYEAGGEGCNLVYRITALAGKHREKLSEWKQANGVGPEQTIHNLQEQLKQCRKELVEAIKTLESAGWEQYGFGWGKTVVEETKDATVRQYVTETTLKETQEMLAKAKQDLANMTTDRNDLESRLAEVAYQRDDYGARLTKLKDAIMALH